MKIFNVVILKNPGKILVYEELILPNPEDAIICPTGFPYSLKLFKTIKEANKTGVIWISEEESSAMYLRSFDEITIYIKAEVHSNLNKIMTKLAKNFMKLYGEIVTQEDIPKEYFESFRPIIREIISE